MTTTETNELADKVGERVGKLIKYDGATEIILTRQPDGTYNVREIHPD